eukprot:4941461-Pyramimonas_sp.AAC.1
MGPRIAVLGGGDACGGALGGAPYGATTHCTGLGMTHAGCAAGAFGGAPYGATKRCTGWG